MILTEFLCVMERFGYSPSIGILVLANSEERY
jgi:hypothetical protein